MIGGGVDCTVYIMSRDQFSRLEPEFVIILSSFLFKFTPKDAASSVGNRRSRTMAQRALGQLYYLQYRY